MTPDPKQEQKATPPSRDLRNVGNEIAGLASELSQSLRADWVRATAEEAPDPKVTERSAAVCIRYGQRLGELELPTETAELLMESEVEALHESSVRDAHGRLARLGSRAAFLLNTWLPGLMERRGALAESLTGLSAHAREQRSEQPFRWHRFLFYLIPAILVLGAEGALAEDITRSAFRLKGGLWWLFPLALLSLPLIFKELLDWKRLDRLQRWYVIVTLVILLGLLVPLSWTRSNEVFRGKSSATQVSSPFGGAPAPRSQGNMYLLTGIFALFGAMFPMVSGLCFFRAWNLADQGLEAWRLRKETEKTSAAMGALDRQIGECQTELDSIQHETVKLIASLSSGDRFVEKILSEVVGSLHGAGTGVVDAVKQKIEGSRGQGGWPELAKQLALDVEALDLKGSVPQQVRVKFQKGLLSDTAQIEKGDTLGRLAETMKKRVRAALSEGHKVGSSAPFAVMAAHSPEEMLHIVRQRKLRDALFGGMRNVKPERGTA